ncbi:MAG: hypothetical protein [Bacteriophage sp.]|nr:MAG: hypothetical protein [Bacteriophage sp.]
MQLNREQRRALKKAKPVKGAGHIQMPITMRFSAEDETKLMLEPIKCAERLRDGTAEEGDWHAVILRLNWGRLLNKANFNEGESLLAEAQGAMRVIKARGLQYGSWSASTPEFNTINTALTICNQMQKKCTRRELRDALQAVYDQNEYLNKTQAIKDRLDALHS